MKAIDLFCGWGGFSCGAVLAGVEVVSAVDLNPTALGAHRANHPQALHLCTDLGVLDFRGLAVDVSLLLASPPCQGFSRAGRGASEDKRKKLRALSWVPVRAIEVKRPRAFVVENVEEMRKWSFWPLWCGALERLGYSLTHLTINAATCGVPQRRVRAFTVGLPKGRTIPPLRTERERPAIHYLDLNASGGWRRIDEAAPGYRGRLEQARARFPGLSLVQHTTGHRGISTNEPIRTITCKDQWTLVAGEWWRPLTVRELARLMGFPDSYVLPKAGRKASVRGLGNAVCPPVAQVLIQNILVALG